MLCAKQNLSKSIHILNTLAEVLVLAILTRSSLQSKEADCDVNTVFCKQKKKFFFFFFFFQCHTRVLVSAWNQSSERAGVPETGGAPWYRVHLHETKDPLVRTEEARTSSTQIGRLRHWRGSLIPNLEPCSTSRSFSAASGFKSSHTAGGCYEHKIQKMPQGPPLTSHQRGE